MQATIIERVYARYGHLLHRAGAFSLEGVVEQDIRRGFSFLVHRIEGLREALAGNVIPTPTIMSAGRIPAGREVKQENRIMSVGA